MRTVITDGLGDKDGVDEKERGRNCKLGDLMVTFSVSCFGSLHCCVVVAVIALVVSLFWWFLSPCIVLQVALQ